jgi:hypothetical protein
MFDPRGIYDDLYATFGVAASLDYGASNPVTFTGLDVTRGMDVGDEASVQTVRPVVRARMYELTAAGVTRDDLDGADVTINGKTWKVKTHRLAPSPAGELEGEVYLICVDEAV